MRSVFVFCRLSISRCMGCCCPTTIGKDFCCFFADVTSNEVKMVPLKMGLLNLRVYYVSARSCKDCYPTIIGRDFLNFFSGLTHHNEKGFLCFASKCKQMYGLLHHQY